nr:MAG TPA: hypothetical protein [Caudoviricetes sp.]
MNRYSITRSRFSYYYDFHHQYRYIVCSLDFPLTFSIICSGSLHQVSTPSLFLKLGSGLTF